MGIMRVQDGAVRNEEQEVSRILKWIGIDKTQKMKSLGCNWADGLGIKTGLEHLQLAVKWSCEIWYTKYFPYVPIIFPGMYRILGRMYTLWKEPSTFFTLYHVNYRLFKGIFISSNRLISWKGTR